MLGKKMRYSNRQIVFKTDPKQDDATLTDDYLVERLVISGTVNYVVDQILRLREQAGEFGAFLRAETTRWGRIIREKGIRSE